MYNKISYSVNKNLILKDEILKVIPLHEIARSSLRCDTEKDIIRFVPNKHISKVL